MAEQRYRVTQRLEAGGMAEVFIGEAQSVQGFKKKVAIKRVLPHLSQNENFIGMFLDEARLGARLNHANIVSVFDIGAADGTYFIVMEFIDGCNLKKIIEVLRRQGRTVPMKEAVYLTMEACRGLSYAHELVDDDGNEINLVHRDVSPPNILISKRGEVKVTDFGLAKATTQLERTDPGVVKGKFSYLSPEAALGDSVDERADIFALGIVLWEMLAGRRLFLGETDYQTVKLVQQAEVPRLSRINPEVDPDFEAVLDRALSRNPEGRYQTARMFGDSLADYLFSHQLKVTSYDIANLVKDTLSDDTAAVTSESQSIIDKLIQDELLRFTSLDEEEEDAVGDYALSPDDVDGAMPLDAGAFENPADWFSDDADLAAALDLEPSQQDSGSHGWRESGLEGLADLEPEELHDAPLDDFLENEFSERESAPVEPVGHVDLSPDAGADERPRAPRISSAPQAHATLSGPPPKKSKGGLVAFLVLLVLGGGGAAAWFFLFR